MIHNHEVPSSILGPATKKRPYKVAFFVSMISNAIVFNDCLGLYRAIDGCVLLGTP